MIAPIVFLIDNGSLRPQATLWLRCLAEALSLRSGMQVEAASLLHSHKIAPAELEGRHATIVKRRLRELVAQGERAFICLPLFLGPSSAIEKYLPEVIDEVCRQLPDVQIQIAAVLAGSNPDNPDRRLARILAAHVRAMSPTADTKVALVDHGTPLEAVNRVRNAVARQLAEELGGEVSAVRPCSMERREGEAYAFNEPLLENLGSLPDFAGDRLILAMFFLLPGRHAGAGGDVTEIYESLLEAGVFEEIQTTALLGENPLLLNILEDRLREAFAAWESALATDHEKP